MAFKHATVLRTSRVHEDTQLYKRVGAEARVHERKVRREVLRREIRAVVLRELRRVELTFVRDGLGGQRADLRARRGLRQ